MNEGLIFLVIGAVLLSLAGLFATVASKKQAEQNQIKENQKGLEE